MPFPLFQNPIELAHSFWKKHITPGNLVIDATCGNGYDTLFLAQLTLTENSGYMLGFDIQKQAIDNTLKRLQENLDTHLLQRITLYHESHEHIDREQLIQPCSLIVYNLGYLPSGDKSITTTTHSTLSSIQKSLQMLAPGGMLSVTCYPGHDEGAKEEAAIIEYIRMLDPRLFAVSIHQFVNRQKSPSLIVIQKEKNFKKIQ